MNVYLIKTGEFKITAKINGSVVFTTTIKADRAPSTKQLAKMFPICKQIFDGNTFETFNRKNNVAVDTLRILSQPAPDFKTAQAQIKK